MLNNENSGKGKHYVISDLHGMYGTYMDAISMLNENDVLYVLGDVIDRGPNGIKILQDIMHRDNVKMFLGNHEWEFIDCYDIMEKYDLSVGEVFLYDRLNNYIKFRKDGSISEESYINGINNIKETLEKYGIEFKFSDALNDGSPQREELSKIGLWMINHGSITLKAFAELEESERKEIQDFLRESSIIGFVDINGAKKCLVHAAPFEMDYLTEILQQKHKPEEYITYNDFLEFKGVFLEQFLHMCTERRQNYFVGTETNPFEIMNGLGYETIFGHTPQIQKATRCKKDNSICIDLTNDGAALYCMETGLVQYIGRSKENPTGHVSTPEQPLLVEDRSYELMDRFSKRKFLSDIITKSNSAPESPENR